MNRLERATGALLGLATGDAVGTTLEFRPPGSLRPIDDMVGGGPFRLAAGEWTDDTSMALCLAESILDTGTLDHQDQLRRYLLWKDHGYLSSNGRCFDIGNTTGAQLERFRRTGQAVDPDHDEEAAANGSLMRLAPVPIRWHADPGTAAERSAESSLTTHPARRPVDACRLMGAMVSGLITGATFEEVTAPGYWKWGELHPAIGDIARGSWRHKQPPAIRGTGYCVAALEAALWAVGGAADFRAAVLRAANLGDDADTTAAIAGQLAGARWGASAIPEEWRRKVKTAPRISSLARQLFISGGGAADLAAWPYGTLITARWVRDGRLLTGETFGSPNLDEKVNVLVDVGVRTFVHLTAAAGEVPSYGAAVRTVATARNLDVRLVSEPTRDRVRVAIDEGLGRGAVYLHGDLRPERLGY